MRTVAKIGVTVIEILLVGVLTGMIVALVVPPFAGMLMTSPSASTTTAKKLI